MTACVERLYPCDQVSVPCFCFDYVFLFLFQEKKDKRKKKTSFWCSAL